MARGADAAPLGMRLSLAFVAVALSAVALLAVLTAVFAVADVNQLSQAQRVKLTQAMGVVAASARRQAGDWPRADLMSTMSLADKLQADIQISDNSNRPVAASAGFGARQGPIERAPILLNGHRVGLLSASFRPGLGPNATRLRGEFWAAIAGAAGLAALVALVVAIAISRRLTRPVVRLIETARAVGAGDRSARVGSLRAPPELTDLARTFDQMADALVRQEQLRRYLVADVAHELRTPVAVLQAGHEALLDGVVSPTPAQLGSLHDEVLRLARLVDDLQTLAAAEAAALHLSFQPCDLADIAAAAADSLAGRFESSHLALERRLCPAPVRADARWMHQVVTNLLGNAAKFTEPGGRVTLSTGLDDDRATLSVSDTGVGITPEQLPHIFERFWRGANTIGATGSGIGLAVVAEVVRAHDGDLDVHSKPGQGTLMVVSLPRALPPPRFLRRPHGFTTFTASRQHPA
ncbi:MAG TPA: ATP-binding protein [Streptosporangiaceae bacterium]|nr:ATP-binding protein [Streptosporangiaceae bacterium]